MIRVIIIIPGERQRKHCRIRASLPFGSTLPGKAYSLSGRGAGGVGLCEASLIRSSQLPSKPEPAHRGLDSSRLTYAINHPIPAPRQGAPTPCGQIQLLLESGLACSSALLPALSFPASRPSRQAARHSVSFLPSLLASLLSSSQPARQPATRQ